MISKRAPDESYVHITSSCMEKDSCIKEGIYIMFDLRS